MVGSIHMQRYFYCKYDEYQGRTQCTPLYMAARRCDGSSTAFLVFIYDGNYNADMDRAHFGVDLVPILMRGGNLQRDLQRYYNVSKQGSRKYTQVLKMGQEHQDCRLLVDKSLMVSIYIYILVVEKN